MKLTKYLYALLASLILFSSCEKNDMPVFDDSQAFVSFRSSTASVGEEKVLLEIPVLLSSVSGMDATVDFEFVQDSTITAVEGINYTVLNSTKTLSYTKDSVTQYIRLSLIDNSTFNGDVKLKIKLTSPQKVSIGASKTIDLVITDDEHPLLFILGSMAAKGTSDFNGAEEWTMTFSKDATDLNKVWITNFVKGGSSPESPVYGVVNADKTEIKIPVAQVIATSTSYPKILLEGFYGPSGDENIPTGGFITGKIAVDGTITIQDWFGSHVYKDAGASSSAGWYNIYQNGITIKKN